MTYRRGMSHAMRPSPSRLLSGLLVALALVASALIGAAPAQAAYSITFTPTAGTVGAPIALTSSVSSGAAGVGVGTVTYYASGAPVATAAVGTTGTVAAASWTPLVAGNVPMYASYASTDGTQAATSPVTSVAIAKAATKTALAAPATSKVGATVVFTATVTAGTYVPTGTVTFQLADGTVLASSTLDAKGVATLAVQMPAAATSYRLKATYNADANTTGSSSDTVTVLVTTSGSVVDLTVSAAPYLVGTPITLTATTTPSNANGSVTFRAGSTVIGAQAVSSGKATITWRPTAAGAVALTASFIPTGETAPLGTDTEQITVIANLPANAISVGPVGQAPWNAGQGYPLRFRTSVTLATKTTSGAPLGLAITGPCTLAGLVITANAGAGTCTLTSTSPATPAYSAARQVNTIALAQAVQTATLTPPAPGKLLRKSIYRLALPNTTTNAGNTVKWRVSYGKKRCKVTNSNDGSVLLRTVKKGKCNVRAYAPPIAGQYLKLKKTFKYRVR